MLTNRLNHELKYIKLDLEHEREQNEPAAFAAYCREVILLATGMYVDAMGAAMWEARGRAEAPADPAPTVAVVESCEV